MLTDEQIAEILAAPKRVISKSKTKVQRSSEATDYVVVMPDGTGLAIYARQSLKDSESFSCGLRLEREGKTLTLCRYNGPSHTHRNPLEDEQLGFVAHIHRATERYQSAGLDADKYAVETDRYTTLTQALQCLVADCNVEGLDLSPQPAIQDLFQ